MNIQHKKHEENYIMTHDNQIIKINDKEKILKVDTGQR